jgi:hypothetical protein
MPNLRFVGLDDAGRLLLRGDDGHEHTLNIDERLEAAVRRDRVGLGQVENDMEALRPRDIQARVRSGESPESVATASGVELERVQRFARPVLQEREHVADTAQQVLVRTGGVEAPLAELVDDRLAHLGNTERTWDAWRRDDGRWAVELSFFDESGPRTARWSFDPHTRSVSVDDDTARAITEGGHVPAAVEDAAAPPAEAPARGAARRLLSVPDLPSNTDAYDEDEITDELAALGLQPVESTPIEVPMNEAPAPVKAAPVEAARVEAAPAGTEPVEAPLTLDLDTGTVTPAHGDPAPAPAAPVAPVAPVAEESASTDADESAEPAAKAKPKKKRASKRASVPSWDDIVFGSRKPE